MNRVLIVEDQKMAQENMESIIKSSENYTLAGIIPNAADAELFCMREAIDLILMDVCTARDENGIEACSVIKKKWQRSKVIVVTSMAEHTVLEKAKGTIKAISCGAGMPFKLADICAENKVFYNPIISSARVLASSGVFINAPLPHLTSRTIV